MRESNEKTTEEVHQLAQQIETIRTQPSRLDHVENIENFETKEEEVEQPLVQTVADLPPVEKAEVEPEPQLTGRKSEVAVETPASAVAEVEEAPPAAA